MLHRASGPHLEELRDVVKEGEEDDRAEVEEAVVALNK